MSKKWKNKLKKQQKAKIIQQATAGTIAQTEAITPEITQEKSENIVTSVISKKEKYAPVVKDNFLPEVNLVKREIKKIAVVFGIIIVILVIVKLVDDKNGMVIKLADTLSKLVKSK